MRRQLSHWSEVLYFRTSIRSPLHFICHNPESLVGGGLEDGSCLGNRRPEPCSFAYRSTGHSGDKTNRRAQTRVAQHGSWSRSLQLSGVGLLPQDLGLSTIGIDVHIPLAGRDIAVVAASRLLGCTSTEPLCPPNIKMYCKNNILGMELSIRNQTLL